MKRLITTLAVVFCTMSSNAQEKNYIKRDTIEVVKYDSQGMEHRYMMIQYKEVGDPNYWERVHKRRRRWNRISLGIFTAGSLAMIIGMATSIK